MGRKLKYVVIFIVFYLIRLPPLLKLCRDGTASTDQEDPASTTGSSSFKYDPADPVPTSGGNNLPDSIGGSIPCGPLDQSSADARSDVLTFQTRTMGDPLYLTGPMTATLFVSSSAIDTDFTVKISDVYPTGEVRIIQDSAVRMRWREGTMNPMYLVPGEVYEIEVGLWNTSYVVAEGTVISRNSLYFTRRRHLPCLFYLVHLFFHFACLRSSYHYLSS